MTMTFWKMHILLQILQKRFRDGMLQIEAKHDVGLIQFIQTSNSRSQFSAAMVFKQPDSMHSTTHKVLHTWGLDLYTCLGVNIEIGITRRLLIWIV